MAPRGPLPPVPGVIKVTIGGNYGPHPWANVLHWRYSGQIPTSTTLAQLTINAGTSWSINMAPRCPSHITLTLITATDLSSATGAFGENIANVPGTRGDDTLTGNAAMLVTYPVPLRYRGGHPRTYLAVGGNADDSDASDWSGAFVIEVQNAWRAFTQSIGTSSIGGTVFGNQCAVSYNGKYKPIVPPTNYPAPEILDFGSPGPGTCHGQVASQRRRIGRG